MDIQRSVKLEYLNKEEIIESDLILIRASIEAAKQAYAPFSKFFVGTALKLDNGEIITGNNQENAAFPSGLCAERVALFAAGAKFPSAKIISMAITAFSQKYLVPDLLCPCGACLQVISESQNKQQSNIRIILHSENATFIADGVQQFLPFSFELKSPNQE